MNEPVIVAVIILVVAVVGLAVGFVARGYVASQGIKAANEKSERIVAEARAQQKDLILQAKEEQVRLQREVDEDGRNKRTDLETMERRLVERDEQLDHRSDMLEERDRKLLLHRREIYRLGSKVAERGLTLVPLMLYFVKGRAKVELALARGKRTHDKRRAIAERESQMRLRRVLKEQSRRR